MNDTVQHAGLTEGDQVDTCCYCLKQTKLGIRVRAAPELVPCRGHHVNEKDTS